MLPILLKAVLVWAAAFNLTLGCAVCWYLLRNWLRHLQQVFYFFLRKCATLWCLSCCRGRLLSIAETEKQDFTKTSTTFFLGFGIKWSRNWGVGCHSSVVSHVLHQVSVPFLEEAKTDTSEECGSAHCGMGAGDGERKLEATFLSETGTWADVAHVQSQNAPCAAKLSV